MKLADAYHVLGVAPGASEAEVRSAHDERQQPWRVALHAGDPDAEQLAYAHRAELCVALDLIRRAGWPAS